MTREEAQLATLEYLRLLDAEARIPQSYMAFELQWVLRRLSGLKRIIVVEGNKLSVSGIYYNRYHILYC